MKKITCLFLDIGGVLLTNGWGHESRYLAAAKFNLDKEEMESRHRITFNTYELGKISLDTYLDRTIFYKKRKFSRDEFKDFMFQQSKKLPGMIAYMLKLKKKYHLKIAIVNNEGKELNEYRIKKFKIDRLVDFYVSSCIVHLRKPDEDIFELALAVAQQPASQVIFIDDRDMFTQVATSLGIHCIHHTSLETTVKQLNKFGLKL